MADNTTEQDLAKANFVLIKSEEYCYTKLDFRHFSEMKEDHQLFSDSNSHEIGAAATIDKNQENIESLKVIDNTAQSDFYWLLGQ